MSSRKKDGNGFIEIQGNPLTKVGVFPYLGYQIGAPHKDRIYKVYRPESELNNPETIKSFRLMPFINNHEMLGEGYTPPEQKGIQGVVGDNVYFDYPYLKGNLKIYGENIKEAIDGGKVELSAGYRCRYEESAGEFEGEHYDYIQRGIRGNHLALVDQGRSGADVSVMDSLPIEIKETLMEEEKISMDSRLDKLEAMLTDILTAMDAKAKAPAKDEDPPEDPAAKAEEAEKTAEEEVKAEEAKEAEDKKSCKAAEDDEMDSEVEDEKDAEIKKFMSDCGLDSAIPEFVQAFKAGMAHGEQVAADAMPDMFSEEQKAMDEAEFVRRIAKRDAMAKELSKHIGTFVCDEMTLQQVAEYGVEKVGLDVSSDDAIVAMDAWLKDREPEKVVRPVMDKVVCVGAQMIEDFYK